MSDEMSEADLLEWQDHTLFIAKKNLIKHNRLHAMAFVLTRQMNLDRHVRARLVTCDTWSPAQIDGSKPRQLAVLTIYINYDDPKTLLNYLQMMDTNGPDAGTFEALAELGRASGHADPEKFIVDTVMKTTGLDGKDIAARFLTKLCGDTEAEAIVKVDEVWARLGSETDPVSMPDGTLAQDETAKEFIFCSLETPTFARALMLPFTRRQRNTGKVNGFGERIEHLDRFGQTGQMELGGRFSGLLPVNSNRVRRTGGVP